MDAYSDSIEKSLVRCLHITRVCNGALGSQ